MTGAFKFAGYSGLFPLDGADGLGLMGQAAAKTGAIVFAGRTSDDVNNTNQQGDRLCQNIQVKLSTRDDKEQHVQGGGPAFNTFHQFFAGRAEVTENGAGHHAHQQQREATMDGSDVKFKGRKTNSEQYKGYRDSHSSASAIEELFYPVQQPAHQATQQQTSHQIGGNGRQIKLFWSDGKASGRQSSIRLNK